jgi:hypothetical protein
VPGMREFRRIVSHESDCIWNARYETYATIESRVWTGFRGGNACWSWGVDPDSAFLDRGMRGEDCGSRFVAFCVVDERK